MKPLTCHIINSDEDQTSVEDLEIGFDNNAELTITLSHDDYMDHGHDCSIKACIDKDNSFLLSRRLKVSLSEIPEAMSRRFSEYSEIVNADFGDVRKCFSDILRFLDSKGCRYTLRRNDGRGGYNCL